MGFLSRLFGGESAVEQKLVEMYTQIFMSTGMPPSEARSVASAMMEKAKENARALGRETLPPNLGEALLQGQEAVPGLFGFIEAAREEGATDDDIRQWWNLHELERQMVILSDDTNRMGLWVQAMRSGMSQDEAAAEVRRTLAMYGDPNDTQQVSGDDRKLPPELKDRVNRWVAQMAATDPSRLKVPKGKTFNALVRAEVRAGRL